MQQTTGFIVAEHAYSHEIASVCLSDQFNIIVHQSVHWTLPTICELI